MHRDLALPTYAAQRLPVQDLFEQWVYTMEAPSEFIVTVAKGET